MHFYLYLQQQLQQSKKTRLQLCESLQISQSTVSLWLSNNRKPDYNKLEKVVSFFAKSPTMKRKHLHFIFFGQ